VNRGSRQFEHSGVHVDVPPSRNCGANSANRVHGGVVLRPGLIGGRAEYAIRLANRRSAYQVTWWTVASVVACMVADRPRDFSIQSLAPISASIANHISNSLTAF
jgi:hypothetical protein